MGLDVEAEVKQLVEEIKRLGGKGPDGKTSVSARPTPHDISLSLRSSKHPEVLNLTLTARDTFFQPRAGEVRCALRRRSLSEHLRGSRGHASCSQETQSHPLRRGDAVAGRARLGGRGPVGRVSSPPIVL